MRNVKSKTLKSFHEIRLWKRNREEKFRYVSSPNITEQRLRDLLFTGGLPSSRFQVWYDGPVKDYINAVASGKNVTCSLRTF